VDYTSESLAVKRFEERRLREKSRNRLVERAENALKLKSIWNVELRPLLRPPTENPTPAQDDRQKLARGEHVME
jgi:hypothetical protein